MISIECVERGLARYIDQEILPRIATGGAKGYTIGIAASLLVKRGGALLREYSQAPVLRQMGLVTADGAVDLDAIRDAALENMPKEGVAVDLPMGIALRITADDLKVIYKSIKQEASV